MKAFIILSLLGLLSSTTIAAPSHSGKKDVNVFLHQPASDHVQMDLGPSLRRGVYTITSPALFREFAIGRGAEDFSLQPKQIKTVATWEPTSQTNWDVEQLSNGHYTLRAGRDHLPVTNIDGRLSAIPFEGFPVSEWIIEYDDERNGFTVISADENSVGLGWTVNTELNAQVEVRPLYDEDTELFTFIPLLNDVKATSKKAGLNIEITVEDL